MAELNSCDRECKWPSKPQLLTIWPFTEKMYQLGYWEVGMYKTLEMAEGANIKENYCTFQEIRKLQKSQEYRPHRSQLFATSKQVIACKPI